MEKKNLITKISDMAFNKYNFVLIYGSCLLLRSVFYLQQAADIFCKLCLVWGIFIILFDMWKYKLKFFKVNDSYLPLLFCGVYLISIIVNFRYSLYGGIKHMMYLIIFLFLLFAVARGNDKERMYHYLKRNNDVFILINALIALASLITFVFNIKLVYAVDSNQYKVGFWFNRLNGVCNSNMETILGLISVGLVIINWTIRGKNIGKIKILYISNLVLQCIYYALSSSRAATVCYAIMLGMFTVFYIFPQTKIRKGIWNAFATTVLLIVLAVAGEWALVKVSRGIMKGTSHLVSSVAELVNPNATGEVEEEEISFERVEDFSEADITNNRMNMWSAAIKIVKQHPVFGITDPNVFDGENIKGNIDTSVFDESDMRGLNAAVFYFHSGYVQLLLCGGIILVAVFLCMMCKEGLSYLKFLTEGDRSSLDFRIALMIAAIVLALLVDNVVEVHLFFSGQDAAATSLWYLMGCGTLLINDNVKKHQDEIREITVNEKV